MSERDEEESVSRLYRGLPREEPPAPLDEAIRAHARRAQETHAAPLVPPTGRRSWAFPIAAAAVIVLAVAVTSQLEREQPDAELSVTPQQPATAKEQAARQEKPATAEKPRADLPAKRKVERAPAAPPASSEPSLAASQSAGAAADSKQAEQAPPAAAAVPAPQAAPATRDEVRAFARSNAVESPERWLERIAELRKEGRDEEADRQLAEFRKRHPGYRIHAEMLEKVERRR